MAHGLAVLFGTLLVAAYLPCGLAGDNGDDFSNNLFSDLAPLLALFGEQVPVISSWISSERDFSFLPTGCEAVYGRFHIFLRQHHLRHGWSSHPLCMLARAYQTQGSLGHHDGHRRGDQDRWPFVAEGHRRPRKREQGNSGGGTDNLNISGCM